ncbi:LysR family transcriptional regulator [Cupriavidus cauae]|uniref:LysR family transcriptional regulator n=1 Tax=Cupriavidus TaxID=106589 RepID=UPI0011EFA843|nr:MULTISPECIES: LysR family transcriptional regulator [Cupriavidus]KAA0183164.1 LysR family transcriptional regulator [Cupriavidus gilardii]MCA7082688.1 LysR family transcriptional regulator [Cupriavidus sp. DB3]UZN51300.1 LysR family transcriptional regulator [Cupriavidus cauae]
MDTKLLAIFDEVYKTRSVSRAGEHLGLPQTSVSLALGRLRKQFGDPLFVRTAEGMLPTPHAETLIQPFRQALAILRTATQQQVVFDPPRSERTFRISMTDISHLQFLPGLMNRLHALAPGIRVEVMRISTDTPKQLESGEADLAVGFMPELEAGFYQQRLFHQGFACVVRQDHPRVDRRMTVSLFKREKHVAITAAGTGHDLLERELERRRVTRNVALSLPTLPGLGNLLANTDLVATVPERVAQMLMGIANVKALAPPFPLPTFSIKQHWHERYHQDPANRWLRSVIADLFLD